MLKWHEQFKPQPISGQKSGLRHDQKMSWHILLKSCSFLFLGLFLLIAGFVILWYNSQLSPLDSDSQLKKIVIKSGENSLQIGQDLEKQLVIRSAFIFDLYTRLHSKNSLLQAGTYRLSSSESIPQIVEHLVKGNVDKFEITFYPGATLVDNSDKPAAKKQDATTVLKRAGYSEEEIRSALNMKNIGPLFAGKPDDAGIEGYIFGETYQFNTGATVEEILQKVFDEFYANIQKEGFIEKFAAHGLNLFQGITLASIVQRESSNPDDQKQISQVFYSRLDQGMVLGSDVTYQYAAAQLGVPATPNLDSPYNTRRFAGLPPGPISSPGLSALQAVADPAPGSYLYFVSDPQGKIHFAKTDAEHQQNIIDYCGAGCTAP